MTKKRTLSIDDKGFIPGSIVPTMELLNKIGMPEIEAAIDLLEDMGYTVEIKMSLPKSDGNSYMEVVASMPVPSSPLSGKEHPIEHKKKFDAKNIVSAILDFAETLSSIYKSDISSANARIKDEGMKTL